MASIPWQAPSDVQELFNRIKEKHHHPRLAEASVVVCFVDSKAFRNGRFNYGRVSRFDWANKIWQSSRRDFMVKLSMDAWTDVLNDAQREALADLHLTRCSVEYEPEFFEDDKGKKHKVVDDHGRVKFSDKILKDEMECPKWRVLPLDITAFSDNVSRHGLWCEDLELFSEAIDKNGKVPIEAA